MILLRPSAGYMWSNCAANPKFSLGVADEPGDPAREGTCAAWVAECVLKGDAFSAQDMLGEVHENGWLVTSDMVYHVQKYIDHVMSRGGGNAVEISAEQRVVICAFIQGTFDSSTVSWADSMLFVDDLKFGMEIVEVFENPQLILYGAGEILRLGVPANITHVRLGIFQPRAFHHEGIYRYWTMTVQEVLNLAQDLVDRGAKCQEPEPVATPGPWCKRCKGAAGCEALAHSIYAGASFIQESSHHRVLTDEEIANELDAIDLVLKLAKARRTALEPDAEARYRKNGLRGWHMKERKGHRKFKVKPEFVHAITGTDPFKRELMTPAELERECADPKRLEGLTYMPSLPSKLEKVAPNHFAQVFRKDK